jgi:pyridoxine/pyridoxamine 5'-phosphate oxidase
VAEWSKALAWKVSIRQKRIEGSNPSRSATFQTSHAESRPKKARISATFDYPAVRSSSAESGAT